MKTKEEDNIGQGHSFSYYIMKAKQQTIKDVLNILDEEISEKPHLFSSHKARYNEKFSNCKVCEVLNKLKTQIQNLGWEK